MNYCIYHCLRLLHLVYQWLVRQLTPMGLGVCVCLVFAWLLGSSTSMLRLLFFFGLALLLLAGVGSRLIQYQFRARRILPRFGTVGEPLRYQVVIEKVMPERQQGLKFIELRTERYPSFQTFLQTKARHPGFGGWWRPWWQQVAQQRTAVAPLQDLPVVLTGAKTKAKAELLPLQRGQLDLKRLSLACPDPLGLIYKHQIDLVPQSVYILPKRYQLPPLYLAKGKRLQVGGTTLVASMGEALEFRSLRDYRAGDPTNKIHWKSWAKVGHPVVKEQQEEAALHYALLLDSFLPSRLPKGAQSSTFEAVLAIAVSFITQPHPEEARLDVIFAGQSTQSQANCITVGRGLKQRGPILEALATLTPCSDRDLDSLMPTLQTRLPHLSGCLCILNGLDEVRVAFLKQLSRYDIPTKVICLCEEKVDPTASSKYMLSTHCQMNLISLRTLQQDLLAL